MATRARFRTLATVLLLGLLVLPGAAHAADYAAPVDVTGCDVGPGGGGRDAANVLYMACGDHIRIVKADGSVSYAAVDLPVLHVAPSPDGRYLYAVDPGGAHRFVRQADGSYAHDRGFAFQRPDAWRDHPTWRVCGWGIATDAYGRIYISNGGWCEGSPNQIIKYRADGTVITSFGEYGIATKWAPCGYVNCVEWNRQGSQPGLFQPNMTLAVTADGSRIWVADLLNQRVQVFERAADATRYEFRTMWSGEGTAADGQLGAIYGVAVDPWGYGYVTQATDRAIWRLDPEARTSVLVARYGQADPNISAPHTVAVDARGRLWVGEWARRIDRTAALPGAVPPIPAEPRFDEAAPTITSVTAPAQTSAASVTVRVDASDDMGVTHLRIGDERGGWGAWRAYASTLEVPLSDGAGSKVVYVVVRDAVGRESAVRWATIRRLAVDSAAPTVRLTAPAAVPSTLVDVVVEAADDMAVTQARFAVDGGAWSAWQGWTTGRRVIAHELGGGTGTRRLAVQVRDAALRESTIASASIVVTTPSSAAGPAEDPAPASTAGGGDGFVAPVFGDGMAPILASVRLPRRSCGTRVLIRLAATDNRGVRQVRVANVRGRWGAWRAFAPSIRHSLTPGRGARVIHVQVRDAAGNVSRVVVRRVVVGC